MPRIITLTLNPALDLASEIERIVPGAKLRCGPVRREAGGGGVNVSRAITSLGGETLALCAAGGATGSLLADELTREGVAHKVLPIAGTTRENLTVLDRATGSRFRFVMPGPTLTAPEWRDCLEAADEACEGDYLVASGSLPPGVPDDFYVRLARRLERTGARLLLDTHGPALQAAVHGGVHLIKPNFREFDELAGQTLSDAGREELAERIVRDGGAEIVIVTLGPAGTLLVSATERLRIAAPEVRRPLSPVGAGDCFMAGLALTLARGRPPAEACAVGVAAAAAAMLTPGTEPCHRDDVEEMLRTMGAWSALEALLGA